MENLIQLTEVPDIRTGPDLEDKAYFDGLFPRAYFSPEVCCYFLFFFFAFYDFLATSGATLVTIKNNITRMQEHLSWPYRLIM